MKLLDEITALTKLLKTVRMMLNLAGGLLNLAAGAVEYAVTLKLFGYSVHFHVLEE